MAICTPARYGNMKIPPVVTLPTSGNSDFNDEDPIMLEIPVKGTSGSNSVPTSVPSAPAVTPEPQSATPLVPPIEKTNQSVTAAPQTDQHSDQGAPSANGNPPTQSPYQPSFAAPSVHWSPSLNDAPPTSASAYDTVFDPLIFSAN
ncbi:hypothetical protein DXG01_007470 [Tephrocybe rancida]|nr:hypothetical protein DXG01_007470 [Tephrocybe rancida]